MHLFDDRFTQTKEYQTLAHALSDPGACALFGLPAAGRALVYAALARALGRPLCIVTPGEAEATRFAADLNTLGVAAAVFPARDYVLRPIEGTAREYEYRRLGVLGDLAGGRLQAVCVAEEGLTQYTTPRADFCANTRTLHPGDTLPREELTALAIVVAPTAVAVTVWLPCKVLGRIVPEVELSALALCASCIAPAASWSEAPPRKPCTIKHSATPARHDARK